MAVSYTHLDVYKRQVWLRTFYERFPSYSQENRELTFTFHVNRDGKIRYEDGFRKNNPYIPMLLPRIYRITAERDLELLQNDLLMFQENVQLKKLRSGSCLFEQAKPVSYTHLDVYKRQYLYRSVLTQRTGS